MKRRFLWTAAMKRRFPLECGRRPTIGRRGWPFRKSGPSHPRSGRPAPRGNACTGGSIQTSPTPGIRPRRATPSRRASQSCRPRAGGSTPASGPSPCGYTPWLTRPHFSASRRAIGRFSAKGSENLSVIVNTPANVGWKRGQHRHFSPRATGMQRSGGLSRRAVPLRALAPRDPLL